MGLVPKIDQSGIRKVIYGVNYYGCMPVRRNIVQAAWSVTKLSFDCRFRQRWAVFRAAMQNPNEGKAYLKNSCYPGFPNIGKDFQP